MILEQMDKMGGNASAQEIADKIDIPGRTVRYRISMMIERGISLPSFLQTSERKIGLGEKILIVQEDPACSEKIEHLVDEIPTFYWYIPVYGRFNGHLIHAVYDMKNPKMVTKIADRMKKTGIIDSYDTFDIVDYESKRVDFAKYSPEGEWDWNWTEWVKGLPALLESDSDIPHKMTADPEIIDCDHVDIHILQILKNDPNTTMGNLSITTDTPIAQVRERVQRLREKKVIRGTRRAYGFVGDLMWFSCFIDIREQIGSVLKCFYDRPFPGVVLMGSERRFCFRFGFETTDIKRFLEGFREIQPYLDDYYFQFHLPDRVESDYQSVFKLFDRESSSWQFPVKEYLTKVDDLK